MNDPNSFITYQITPGGHGRGTRRPESGGGGCGFLVALFFFMLAIAIVSGLPR